VNILWGIATAAIGVLFVAWGRSRSEFVAYRLLAARSRVLWGARFLSGRRRHLGRSRGALGDLGMNTR
jgi:hypothetical protein